MAIIKEKIRTNTAKRSKSSKMLSTGRRLFCSDHAIFSLGIIMTGDETSEWHFKFIESNWRYTKWWSRRWRLQAATVTAITGSRVLAIKWRTNCETQHKESTSCVQWSSFVWKLWVLRSEELLNDQGSKIAQKQSPNQYDVLDKWPQKPNFTGILRHSICSLGEVKCFLCL